MIGLRLVTVSIHGCALYEAFSAPKSWPNHPSMPVPPLYAVLLTRKTGFVLIMWDKNSCVLPERLQNHSSSRGLLQPHPAILHRWRTGNCPRVLSNGLTKKKVTDSSFPTTAAMIFSCTTRTSRWKDFGLWPRASAFSSKPARGVKAPRR